MTTSEILFDYLDKTLKANRPLDFKKLLKIQTDIFELEITLDDSRRIIREREALISDLSNSKRVLSEDKSKLVLEVALIKKECLELSKQNDNLKDGL